MESTPAQDVTPVAPSATSIDADIAAALDADMGVTAESPPADPVISEEIADSNADPQEAAEAPAPQEASSVADKPKNDLSPGIRKRIDKLTAARRQVEEALNQKELELARYKQAFQLIQEQYARKDQRLQEIDPTDPIVAENERLKFERRIQEVQTQVQQEWEAKVNQAAIAARTQAAAEQLQDEVTALTEQYPTVSPVDILLEIRKSPGTPAAQIAKTLHEARYKRLEAEFTSKYKDRMNAPRPVTPTGSVTPRTSISDSELIAELEAEFGPDWHRPRA